MDELIKELQNLIKIYREAGLYGEVIGLMIALELARKMEETDDGK